MAPPFDLTPAAMLWLAIAVFGAAFIRGYSGFGFSALVVTASALVTSPLNLVPVVMLLEVAATAGQARGAWASLNGKTLLLLLAGASVAMPASIFFISALDIDIVRLVISIWILAMCACLLAGWSLKARAGTGSTLAVGVVSGIANAAAVGGLPVALFLAAQSLSAATFRGTMIFYLCAIDVVALPILALNGFVTLQTFVAAAMCVPLLAAGVWLGGRKFNLAAPENFRRMAVCLLASLAMLGLLKSLI